ncbi:hypothetical protein [Candidatus Viadribacter manganicus]|nr:hypothetical protein [Candidatus Viadribacter manganicus]
MVGVAFVFVREDASDLEALAEAFDEAGYQISGNASSAALCVIVWSRAAARSEAFQEAAERALERGGAVVASLAALPRGEDVARAPAVDLSAWDGIGAIGLERLFEVAADVTAPARPRVIALPSRPIHDDAEFADAPLQMLALPAPAGPLKPVQDEVIQTKFGAPSPRRDFRRLRRTCDKRAHAALVFAVVTLTAGSLLITAAQSFTTAPQPKVHVVDTGGVSLTHASVEAIGLEDAAPIDQERLFEPPVQVGHAGFEPPSARAVRQASYQP